MTTTAIRGAWIGWAAGMAAFAAAAVVLFFFDPSNHGFYPICFFHKATGLLCPGCGALRATHQLLHGNLSAAFRFNPLLVLALPLVGLFGAVYAFRTIRGYPTPLAPTAKWVWLLAGIGLALSVWRNFPGSPFGMPRG